jgi:murein DD-endopeptidase MepM/ murein hydrolase activator NlpD
MFPDAKPSLSLPTPGPDRLTTLERTGAPAAEKEKLGELAAQFESMLMLEMIKQMRKSLLDESGEEEGLGKETYSSTIDQELALHLAKAGGMGLTSAMVEAWERQQTAMAPGSLAAPAAGQPVVTAPVAMSTAASSAVSAIRQAISRPQLPDDTADSTLSLEMPGRVSSGYGWRADPLQGRSRFHGGIDLAAKYGTTVPAAAAGTVVTAEAQGSYGLTVVLRHPDGFESRYAHLASLDVTVGETVAQGQQVGRVGSTGRSTGPHLHFEVMQSGRRVDPEQFVRNLTTDIKGQ